MWTRFVAMSVLFLACFGGSAIPGLAFTGTPEEQRDKAVITQVQKSAVQINVRENVGSQGNPLGFASTGSGVIISSKGDILTNDHVASIPYDLFHKDPAFATLYHYTIILPDKKEYTALLKSVDPFDDLAILQIVNPPKNLVPIKRGDRIAEVGDHVWSIGNPFGLPELVSKGIISGVSIEGPLSTPVLVTDARINRGNSGGALFNTDAALAGINTAILSREGGNIGIGFAIPAEVVWSYVSEYEHNLPTNGRLGIKFGPLDRNLIKPEMLGSLPPAEKSLDVFVANVVPDSAADNYLEPGDVIVSIDGMVFPELWQFARYIAHSGAESKIHLVVWRDGIMMNFYITLGDADKDSNKQQ